MHSQSLFDSLSVSLSLSLFSMVIINTSTKFLPFWMVVVYVVVCSKVTGLPLLFENNLSSALLLSTILAQPTCPLIICGWYLHWVTTSVQY